MKTDKFDNATKQYEDDIIVVTRHKAMKQVDVDGDDGLCLEINCSQCLDIIIYVITLTKRQLCG